MRLPLSWLKEFNETELSVEDLADLLTRAGLEVEAIERIGIYSDRIVVGEILEVRPIAETNNLHEVDLQLGDGQQGTAVTGAPNITTDSTGTKAPVALSGAILLDSKSESFALTAVKPREFRGVQSSIVLCSEMELGLSEDHTGVLLLDEKAEPGGLVRDLLEIPTDCAADVVFEIDILPNYGRCLSIIGIAREVAALTRTPFKLEIKAEHLPTDPEAFKVSIENPGLAPRYSGLVLEDVKVEPSPAWMQRRLALAGLSPINNLVDVTNYVMVEMGQPMHAFDLDKLPEEEITVRAAREGEKLFTLDQEPGGEDGEGEKPRELDESTLLITSGGQPIAVAGVIGGLDSEISDSTARVLLESANFNFISIRKAMSKLKLMTDAATRFSRQIDPAQTVTAIQRAVHLLQEIGGAKATGSISDCYPEPAETRTLTVRNSDITRNLGVELEDGEIASALERLGFTADAPGEGLVEVSIPGFRPDVSHSADIAEEVIRVIGFDRLEGRLLNEPLPSQRRNESWEQRKKIRSVLTGCGLSDVLNYSLTTPEAEARLLAGEPPVDELPAYVQVMNKKESQDRSSLRRTVLGSLMENIATNHRERKRIALFEIGKVYLSEYPSQGGGPGDEKLPCELLKLSMVLSGPLSDSSWKDAKPRDAGFHDLKGITETLLNKLHVQEYEFTAQEGPPYHPGVAALLMIDGKLIGTIGKIHPKVIEAYDLGKREVFAAEFDHELLLEASQTNYPFRPFSSHPAIFQDLALVVDDDVEAGSVMSTIREAAGELLTDISLFDIYRGEQLGEGKKSLAFQLTFCAGNRSLEEKEINDLRESMLGPLEEKLGAKIRA